MEKIKTGWKLPPLPLPVALLEAIVCGRPNFFTIVWFTMLDDDPPLIGAAMSKKRYTKKGIEEKKTFSINIPPSQMAEVVDYCGLHSGSATDKSSLFSVFYGELGTAPMIEECGVNMECRLVDSHQFKNTELLIGRIVQIYCDEKYLSSGKPDYRKIDPMLFFMPDGPYFAAGEFLAEAYKVGKTFDPESGRRDCRAGQPMRKDRSPVNVARSRLELGGWFV